VFKHTRRYQPSRKRGRGQLWRVAKKIETAAEASATDDPEPLRTEHALTSLNSSGAEGAARGSARQPLGGARQLAQGWNRPGIRLAVPPRPPAASARCLRHVGVVGTTATGDAASSVARRPSRPELRPANSCPSPPTTACCCPPLLTRAHSQAPSPDLRLSKFPNCEQPDIHPPQSCERLSQTHSHLHLPSQRRR